MYNTRIVETGVCLPEQVITNDDLAKIVDTNDEWIRTRTGIGERRISGGENTSELAAEAAKLILDRAGVKAEDVELLIVGTCSGDYNVPSVACMVQKSIGAVNAVAFDITAACSGFVFGLSIADKYIKSGLYKNAIVLGAEVLSKMIDWTDRTTCVLFGDGAAGAYVERSTQGGILAEEIGSEGARYEALTAGYVPAANAFNDVEPMQGFNTVYMDGREVFKFATKRVTQSILSLLEKENVKAEDICYVVPHQANARIVEIVAKKTGIPMEKFYLNMDHTGNTSAASIPIALHEMNEQGMIKPGDKIILTGFGGGLTWGTMLVEW